MNDPWKEQNGQQPARAKHEANQQPQLDDKAWKLLEKAVMASTKEMRRTRRWGIFFKLLTFAYLFGAMFLLMPNLDNEKKASGISHSALIEVRGMIAEREDASADKLVTALRNAFSHSDTRGIILRINSPGGSPVQSGYVYDEIRRLRTIYPHIKVYAVISDLGASGAYYIASAADEIYADKSSLVGSIGVTAASFGFVDSMRMLGVERRVYTSGEHKAFLDPFQPQKPEETRFWKEVLNTTHQQFINSVKQGRGERLKYAEHPELFSGLIWSGEQALELGLIDGLGNSSYVAREIIGVERIKDFSVQDSPLDRFAKRFGASVGAQLSIWLGLDQPQLR